jgi:hypothetical protein
LNSGSSVYFYENETRADGKYYAHQYTAAYVEANPGFITIQYNLNNVCLGAKASTPMFSNHDKDINTFWQETSTPSTPIKIWASPAHSPVTPALSNRTAEQVISIERYASQNGLVLRVVFPDITYHVDNASGSIRVSESYTAVQDLGGITIGLPYPTVNRSTSNNAVNGAVLSQSRAFADSYQQVESGSFTQSPALLKMFGRVYPLADMSEPNRRLISNAPNYGAACCMATMIVPLPDEIV